MVRGSAAGDAVDDEVGEGDGADADADAGGDDAGAGRRDCCISARSIPGKLNGLGLHPS